MLFKSSGGFKWSVEAETSFKELKTTMTEASVLALPDYSQDLIVETDASGKGIGAVLMQNGHPIAFISKAISNKHQSLSAYDK